MTTNLVDEFRRAPVEYGPLPYKVNTLLSEAVDTLQRLQAALDAATGMMMVEAEANNRLRAALEQIANIAAVGGGQIERIARKALEEAKTSSVDSQSGTEVNL